MKTLLYCLIPFSYLLLINSLSAQNCSDEQIYVQIDIIPDRAADDEAHWRLTDQFGTVLLSGSSQGGAVCVESSRCLTFTIEDSFGDGLQDYGGFPDGRFSVYYDEQLMARDTNFGHVFTVQMGDCPLGSSCSFPIVAQTDWVYPAQVPNNWYEFVADETGRYTISTCDLTNHCNTAIWVYDYCEGLKWDDTQIGAIFYNDDSCGELAEASMILEAKKTYFIRIGGDESCEKQAINWQVRFQGPIMGCMDMAACNFEPLATVADENACIYQGAANCPDGPDLVVLEYALRNSLHVSYLQNEDACAIQEGCLQGYGTREVLRFTTHIRNIGDKDFYLGKPPANIQADQGEWEWDDCHSHWHYEGYAEYLLYDAAGSELPIGFKNGFCVVDLDCPNGENKYDCANQGITSGCGDIYDFNLACQWVDVTDLEEGDYTLVVRVNWQQKTDALGFYESDYHNNWAKVCLRLERDQLGKAILTKMDNCEVITDCLGEVYGTASADCTGNCTGSLKIGDRNGDLHYTTSDVNIYLHEILSENLQSNSCTDLNSDGKITIADPALLVACELESNGIHNHPSVQHNHCELPTSNIFNPNHQVTFTIGDWHLDHQYIDVYIQNPHNSIVAFELQISGIDIMSVFPHYDTEVFELPLHFNSNGKLFGLAFNDKTFAKNHASVPFFRVYYSAITKDDICISQVEAVLNHNYETVSVDWSDACMDAILWNDIETIGGEEANIHIAPNPFSDFTIFYFDDSPRSNTPKKLQLMDLSGRIVASYNCLGCDYIRVDKANLAAGIYLWKFGEKKGKLLIN